MDYVTLLGISRRLDASIDRYQDIIGEEAFNLSITYGIDKPDKLANLIKDIENSERTLRIGIVGRVNSGKSSFLNALVFDGASILPKAVTPMTAALTVLSYGDELSADVQHFTSKDIADVKACYDKYEDNYKNRVSLLYGEYTAKKTARRSSSRSVDIQEDRCLSDQDLAKLHKKAEQRAKQELRSNSQLQAAHDHYRMVRTSGHQIDSFSDESVIKAESLRELNKALLSYVTAEGEYTPFTKSVQIKLPMDIMKDVEIIDTPGLNDPVASREDRTRKLLKKCDVVFILSPSGQFLSKEDVDLMDRITAREGVRELYVIASQVDLQLFGSEKDKHNGMLPSVLHGIGSTLGEHMSNTLISLKQTNPEIQDSFDQLIDQGKEKVVHSSSICHLIKKRYDDKDEWDSGMQKVMENLIDNYPDAFSETDKQITLANLELLSNRNKHLEILEHVRMQKDSILKEREQSIIHTKIKAIREFKEELLGYASAQLAKIKSTSVRELAKQKRAVEKVEHRASSAVKSVYEELIEELGTRIKLELKATVKKLVAKATQDVFSKQSEKIIYEHTGSRHCLVGKRKKEAKQVVCIRTGAALSIIHAFQDDAELELLTAAHAIIKDWKRSLYSRITSELSKIIDQEHIEPELIRYVLRKVINRIVEPNFELKSISATLPPTGGVLLDSEAEAFMSECHDYLRSLKSTSNKMTEEYRCRLVDTLKSIDLSSQIFENFKERIARLENEIKTKKVTIDRFDKFVASFEKVIDE